MLSRILSVAAITLCVSCTETTSEFDADFKLNKGTDGTCVPFAGCIGDQGEYFTGRALGWDKGPLSVRSSTGTLCTGDWIVRPASGSGRASIVCDDGTKGTAEFTYQHPETGTAVGEGQMSDGRSLKVWSGRNIQQFLAATSGTADSKLSCGGVMVPLT